MRTPTKPKFTPLTDSARDELTECRNFVSGLAARLLGPAANTDGLLELMHIQQIARHPSMKHANSGAWVALGVAFGDALCALVPGLNWAAVTDDFGTHTALRFRESTITLSAPTMLQKRVERGDDVDVVHLAGELKTFIDQNADDYQ